MPQESARVFPVPDRQRMQNRAKLAPTFQVQADFAVPGFLSWGSHSMGWAQAHSIGQNGFELPILLPSPSQCWKNTGTPPHLAENSTFSVKDSIVARKMCLCLSGCGRPRLNRRIQGKVRKESYGRGCFRPKRNLKSEFTTLPCQLHF